MGYTVCFICDTHLITVDHQILTVDHQILTVDHQILTVDHQILTVDHQILTVDHQILIGYNTFYRQPEHPVVTSSQLKDNQNIST